MEPVPQNLLDRVFRPMLPEWLKKTNLDKRSSVDGYLSSLEEGYKGRKLSAFTDSLEKPTYWLVLGVSKSFILDKPTAIIYTIYGLESDDRPKKTEDAITTATAFAGLHGCGDLLASSWTYLGAVGSAKTWKRHGFQPQETTFTKPI